MTERTVDKLLDQLQETLNELSEAAEEQAESEYQRGVEEGYQDGLNDAYGFIKDYLARCREDDNSDEPMDPHYIDALDDALITLQENGAEDVAAQDQAVAEDQNTTAPVAESAADVDENVDSP